MTCNRANTDGMTWDEFQEWSKEQQKIEAEKIKKEQEAALEQEALEKEAEREQFLLDLQQIYIPIAIGIVLTIVLLVILYMFIRSRFL